MTNDDVMMTSYLLWIDCWPAAIACLIAKRTEHESESAGSPAAYIIQKKSATWVIHIIHPNHSHMIIIHPRYLIEVVTLSFPPSHHMSVITLIHFAWLVTFARIMPYGLGLFFTNVTRRSIGIS